MKQTAIEWLLDELPHLDSELLRPIIDKAKAMEKEQIKDAYLEGESDGDHLVDSGENYYNKTYLK